MNKDETSVQDELRSEYHLESLEVRKVGPGRTGFGRFVVQLDPDVAEVFSNAKSVNEALRFLIRVTRENKPVLPGTDEGV